MAGRCFGGWSIIDWDVKLISCRIFWHPGPFADTAHLPLASACVNHVGERDIFFTAPCPTYYWGHGPCGPGGPSPWYQLKLNASRAKRMKGGRSHFQPGLSIGSWPVTALPGVFINFQEEDNPPAVGTRPGSGCRSLDSDSAAGREPAQRWPHSAHGHGESPPCPGVQVPCSPQPLLRWSSYSLRRENLLECPRAVFRSGVMTLNPHGPASPVASTTLCSRRRLFIPPAVPTPHFLLVFWGARSCAVKTQGLADGAGTAFRT